MEEPQSDAVASGPAKTENEAPVGPGPAPRARPKRPLQFEQAYLDALPSANMYASTFPWSLGFRVCCFRIICLGFRVYAIELGTSFIFCRFFFGLVCFVSRIFGGLDQLLSIGYNSLLVVVFFFF